jgi:hypothetical protein
MSRADLSFLLQEILDGGLPEDPATFISRLNRLVLKDRPKVNAGS